MVITEGQLQELKCPIGKVQLPAELVSHFNEIFGSLTEDYRYNLVTTVKQSRQLPADVLSGEHGEYLLEIGHEFLDTLGQDQPMHITDGWINGWVDESEDIPIHKHGDSALSLVGYLLMPDDKKASEGNTSFGMNDDFVPEAIVGEAYIFPAELPHKVDAFSFTGERRTFSINYRVED